MHLSFQSCGNLVVITYQQLTSIPLDSPQCRTAISCTLANIACSRPATPFRGRYAAYETELAIGRPTPLPERELNQSLSRPRGRLAVTNLKVTDVTTEWGLASGPLVPINSSRVLFRSPGLLPYLFVEQFWGRAVRASRDSLNPGRFLFVVKFPGEPTFPRHYGCFQHYLPRSSESIGISSLFPDDKLR